MFSAIILIRMDRYALQRARTGDMLSFGFCCHNQGSKGQEDVLVHLVTVANHNSKYQLTGFAAGASCMKEVASKIERLHGERYTSASC